MLLLPQSKAAAVSQETSASPHSARKASRLLLSWENRLPLVALVFRLEDFQPDSLGAVNFYCFHVGNFPRHSPFVKPLRPDGLASKGATKFAASED